MTYRIRNIGIAVALAVVAALLTTFYVTNYKRTVQQGEETVPVYVASHDIPLGTSGADVTQRSMIRVEHVTRRSVVPGAISKPDQIDDLVAVEPIYAGEQVSTKRFRTAEEQGIKSQLKGNMRAIQVAGSDSAAAGRHASPTATAWTSSETGNTRRGSRLTSPESCSATCSSCRHPT